MLLHSPVKYMSSALKSGIYTLIFSILVALILASISAVWLSISFTKPLNKIRDTTTELAKGNYEVTTQVKQSDEIGELAKSIDKLALQLDKKLKKKVNVLKKCGKILLQIFLTNCERRLQ